MVRLMKISVENRTIKPTFTISTIVSYSLGMKITLISSIKRDMIVNKVITI